MTAPLDLPDSFNQLRDLVWTPITIGKSASDVWRIALPGGSAVFVKAEKLHPLGELPGEIERLNWLTRMGFKAPRVVDSAQGVDELWLLMTAVPGADLTRYTAQPSAFVQIYAQGLKRMHALDPTHCPFDHSIDPRLVEAERRLAAGLVDETDFDTQRQGWTGQQIMDWLHANRPPIGDAIVTHGDASTPNLMADNGRFSGMIDCSRMGRADVWQDLAIACRSIAFNIGEAHVPAFLAAYGAEWDEVKYRFYCTLDEMF